MLEVVMTFAMLLLLLGAVRWAGGGKTLHETQGSGIIEAIPGALETSPPPEEELVVLSYSIAYGVGDPRPTGRGLDPAAVYDRLDADHRNDCRQRGRRGLAPGSRFRVVAPTTSINYSTLLPR